MGSGIVQFDGAIAGSGRERSCASRYDCTDRHLAAPERFLRFVERDAHGQW